MSNMEIVPAVENLTEKQRNFVYAYIETQNATKAAKLAGYSERSAAAMGWENLQKPLIREALRQFWESKAMGAAELLGILADQARGDVSDVVQAFGTVLIMAPADIKKYGHLLKSVKNGPNGIEVTFYDKQRALELIGRNLRMFTDKVEHEHQGEITLKMDI